MVRTAKGFEGFRRKTRVPVAPVAKTELDAADRALLAQTDKLIEQGGGWAQMKNLPGGSDWVWSMINLNILEEDGGFVRRAPAGYVRPARSRSDD